MNPAPNEANNQSGPCSNMGQGGFEFGTQHSAEWLYSIQKTCPFWKEVLKKFDVDTTNQ
jgi:hypothetical protein